MVTRLWTSLLVLLAGGFMSAWLVALMHEREIRPARELVKFFRKLPRSGRVIIGALFVALWIVAGTKPGGGGGNGGGEGGGGEGGNTNNVQNVANVEMLPIANTNVQLESNATLENGNIGTLGTGNIGTGNIPTLATLITSTNTTRTLDGDDFRRGFVLARVGTGEKFDFSATSNATVCADWLSFGAAADWIYGSVKWKVESGKWRMENGERETDDETMLRIHSDGWAEVKNGPVFSPFKASLGIVPEANWQQILHFTPYTLHSQFWHFVTPSNTLQLTWQNVLLDRLTNTPVSVQMEVWPSGRFVYRYDLSRLNVEEVTNILVGACFGGLEWVTNSIPTNITSMAFYPLSPEDASNQDPDNDGLLTIDELFVYGTDPHDADSDHDGLSDGEELFASGTDPLDPHSAGGAYSDGLAVRLGGLDPFSFPEGSTNTILEHVFYSGSTNGAFAFPESTESLAVLRVSVSGFGTGDLIVGGRVVPLVAPPQMRSAPHGPTPPLLVQIAKGETYPVYIRGDPLLEVALASSDFAFGVLPTNDSFGRVNFPNTAATPACIHDFNARRKSVTLPVGRDARLLSATWTGDMEVDVENVPPRSATVTGYFPAGSDREITYTLSHPQYLFGQTTYDQTVRFCPRPPPPDPDEPDPEPPPSWLEYGEGDSSEVNETSHDEHWCCWWGTCGAWCECGCSCGSVTDEIDDDDFDEDCPVHHVPYANCAYLHEYEYENSATVAERLGGVLYIRDPPLYEQLHLDVPPGHRNCCPCPDHWTNWVGVAYKSYRLHLIDSNGLPFNRSETSCDVNLAGAYPSSAVGDATLAFARNGEICLQYRKTVLGVAVRGKDTDLAACNALNAGFGFPMTVCTNFMHAPTLKLVSNVKLQEGNVHLALDDASGQFAVWYLDRRTWAYRKLLDSQTMPTKDLPMVYWRALMKRATYGDTVEMPVYVTSSEPGSVDLRFRYWAVIDGKFVEDEAHQRITSVRPPLRLDITRDGSIDDGDSAAWFDGRMFYYWVNEDKIYGDYIVPDREYTVRNSLDLVVNGTFDLVNLFPVALDLSKFTDAWQNRVTYTLCPEWGNTNSFNFCFADIPWNEAGKIQTTNVTTLAGQPLSSASLTSLPKAGYQLHYYDTLTQFSENSGLLICEAKSRYASMRLDIKVGDTLLYSYSVPMTILPVKEMYSWYNFRSLSGETAGRETTLRPHPEEYTKSLIFLHGANVSTDDAEQWGDIIFKRMWISGSRVRFYNVDWRSNIGGKANYHQNASNAFVVASQIVSTITNAIPGEKVVMAHSLGNMVVSSMIQDYGLQVSKYLMCDSAVPSEAYYPANDVSIRVPQLVHPQWEEYPTNSWASNWHKLFVGDSSDDRRLLGWPGRFLGVTQNAVNFYSTGDEVLELNDDNDIYVWTGATSGYVQYSWHHQELWKGRAAANVLGGTTWSGWNIEENWLGVNKISVSEAQQMQPEDFKTNTVFYCYPSSMNSTNISLLVRAAHLTQGIPALARPTGGTNLVYVLSRDNAYDLNLDESTFIGDDEPPAVQGMERPNGWPTRSKWGTRWTHSDMKDVSYFYNFKFYEKVIEKGALR